MIYQIAWIRRSLESGLKPSRYDNVKSNSIKSFQFQLSVESVTNELLPRYDEQRLINIVLRLNGVIKESQSKWENAQTGDS